MQRALRICRQVGCTELVISGYCAKHARVPLENKRKSFEALDARKTTESQDFYSSARWTKISRLHRQYEPLCRRCKERGIVKAGDLAHHNPPREELLAAGLNPFDDQYLETLCLECHQEDLRKKK